MKIFTCVCVSVRGGTGHVTGLLLCTSKKGKKTERKDEKGEDLSYFRNARGNEEMKPHLPTYLPPPTTTTTTSRLGGGGFSGEM